MPVQYGLIGLKLGHSFSKDFFTKKFLESGINDKSYHLFELNSIQELPSLIASNNQLVGLNVTIPFKMEVIPFLDELSVEASAIGAVNTIKIDRSDKIVLKGFNTDAYGFEKSIKPFLDMHHQRALVLGNGGASKAVQYVLKNLGIDYLVVTRNPEQKNHLDWNSLSGEMVKHSLFIVNTTSVGMSPDNNKELIFPYDCIGNRHFVVDLIYNPSETKLLFNAKSKGAIVLNGLNMLHLQAEKSYEIWNS